VEDPGKLGEAWDFALTADRPVILEVRTDPNIPLLPPFPAGEEKLKGMRSALSQEGPLGEHARKLLDSYAEGETKLRS
jgi:pyruvate dehydrogenase (quinone)